MARIIAIDYGQKRVGFAATDELRICANALDTVHVTQAFDYLKNYLEKENVDAIVICQPRKKSIPHHPNRTCGRAVHLKNRFSNDD